MIVGLEVYTSKLALQAQVEDKVFFQSYHETVKRESLYSEPEELVAWYLADGFLARDVHAKPFGGGVVVSVTHLHCKDREQVLEFMK